MLGINDGVQKSQNAAAKITGTDSKYISRTAQGDTETKYLYRVALTEKGKNVAMIIRERNQQTNADLLKLFSPDELMFLSQIARKLWNMLSEKEAESK